MATTLEFLCILDFDADFPFFLFPIAAFALESLLLAFCAITAATAYVLHRL